MRTEDVISSLVHAQTIGEIGDIASTASRYLGFDGFYYINYEPSVGFTQIDNRPQEWLDRYKRKGYLYFDVITAHVARNVRPFIWEQAVLDSGLGRYQGMMLDEARDFGLKNGYNVLSHGTGYQRATTCFYAENSTDFFDTLKTNRNEIDTLAHVIHGRFGALRDPIKEPPHLAPRELECLAWAARGKTNEEIGIILSISANTVNSYIQSAAKKLGVYTKIHAVVKAIQFQLIFPF